MIPCEWFLMQGAGLGGEPWARPPAWMAGVAAVRIDCMFSIAAVAAQHRGVSHTTAPGSCQSRTAQAVPALPSLWINGRKCL